MSFRAERILAETKRCSVAKRLPPPCAGMPVRVPQPVRDKVVPTNRTMSDAVFKSEE